MATNSLPPNWPAVLEPIEQSLTQAIHLAQDRETALADPASPGTSPGTDPLAKFLEGLDARIQQIQAPLEAFDQVLKNEQEHVRDHLATVARLRHRLADWGGRAIG